MEYATTPPFIHGIPTYFCKEVNCPTGVRGNIIDYMAKSDTIRPTSSDASLVPAKDFERQCIELFGPDAGPQAYQHLLGIIALLDKVPEAPLHPTLQHYISDHGIDVRLAVADTANSMVIAYTPDHAKQLKRQTILRKMLGLGETILRAPQ